MADPDPLDLLTCPFNMSHQVARYRMPKHIQKCGKQNRTTKKVTCPFDSTHILDEAELDHHVSHCKARHKMDYHTFCADKDTRPVVPVQPPPEVHCEENWENETTTSYVPDPSRMAPSIILKVHGATPSERRKARMEGIQVYRPPTE
ncbi:gametocyte-specific factor 1 [Bicyclus anynana]|uniref:Gametocyte-specific factor 1 n=1 Tax=Bicyclus anynana TaxID=110368 RepID=A0A6J1P5Z2_BICAN|nr:gametocyte-specific factor 1 [Bicyclus anynana]